MLEEDEGLVMWGVKVVSVAIVERLWPLTIRTSRKEGDHNDEIEMRGLEKQRNLK